MKTGEQLRDEGIQQAIENADKKNYNWSETAYAFLKGYCKANGSGHQFLTEDVRYEAEYYKHLLPDPPSKRAWGGVILKAKHEKIIIGIGYDKVLNPKAHCAFATIWEVL